MVRLCAAPVQEVGVALVVQKYGGSSVSDADRIKKVAERIVRTHKEGNDVVVVASAMGDTTDELLDLAEQVSPASVRPPPRAGHAAHRGRAHLQRAARDGDPLPRGRGPLVHRLAGGHGDHQQARRRPDRRRSTRTACGTRSTRARSCWSPGSRASRRTRRTSPRSAAAAPTPPPWRWPRPWRPTSARSTPTSTACTPPTRGSSPTPSALDAITYEEMLEMAACGAKVLHLRAVEYARRYNVPLRVRSSYTDKPGSLVTGSIEEIPLENAIITGVAHDRSEAKITVTGVPDTPGMAARIFRTVADAEHQHRHGAAEHQPHLGAGAPTSRSRCPRSTGRARWPRSPPCSRRSASAR